MLAGCPDIGAGQTDRCHDGAGRRVWLLPAWTVRVRAGLVFSRSSITVLRSGACGSAYQFL